MVLTLAPAPVSAGSGEFLRIFAPKSTGNGALPGADEVPKRRVDGQHGMARVVSHHFSNPGHVSIEIGPTLLHLLLEANSTV